MLFNWFRRARQLKGRYPKSRGEVFLRTVLLIGLVVVMMSAFWNNSERYVYKFNALGRITDDTGMLDKDRKEAIQGQLIRFDKEFRIKVHVRVSKVPLTSREARAGEIFFGLCPPVRQSVLIMPPEWESALDETLLYSLKNDFMEPYFAAGDWPAGAVKALETLYGGFVRILDNPLK